MQPRRSQPRRGGAGQRPQSPGGAQGAPPAAVALGADLADGGGAVLILVGQLVDLVGQLLHRARPEAAPRADGLEVGEAVNALAVALDADVSILPAAARQEERAGVRAARGGPRRGQEPRRAAPPALPSAERRRGATRARCPRRERPRRFATVALSREPELELLFYTRLSQ